MDSKLDLYQEQVLKADASSSGLRFFLSSTVLHLSLFATALLLNDLFPIPEAKDIIEVSVQDFEKVPPVEVKSVKVSVTPEKVIKATSVPKAPTKVVESIINEQPPQKQSEISTAMAQSVPVFQESDIDEALDNVEVDQGSVISGLKTEMEESSQKILSQQDEDEKLLRQESNRKAQVLAQHAAQMKAEDNARLQSQLAAEKAAEAAAASQALAAKRAAAEAVAAEEAAGRAQAAEMAKELAYGNSLGVDVPVRSLQELKQIPGNAKPLYDSEDRLSSRQGEVAFLAYVDTSGHISKFKLLRSTGHRALDAKTYAAIKNWKFYPGQEGWVEIPFQWDLKGGAQEKTTTLRRSLSQK